jgi:predicted nucleic acid-binding protein
MGLTYIDSCVLIDALVNPERRGDDARAALEGERSGGVCTSALVELECMVRPLRSGDQNWIASMRSALARFRPLEITARCYQLAAHLRALHGLKTADALHVATASLGGCDEMWTSDRQVIVAMSGFAIEPPTQR